MKGESLSLPDTRTFAGWSWMGRLAADLALWSLAAPIALYLRLEGDIARDGLDGLLLYVGIGVVLHTILLTGSGLERRSWAKSSTQDLVALATVVAAGSILELGLGSLLNAGVGFPRTVPIVTGAIALLLMGGARMGLRITVEELARNRSEEQSRVLLVGAGDAGTSFAREMKRNTGGVLKPVGFLDDDPALAGMRIGGIPVLGTIASLPGVARSHGVDEALICMPSAPGSVTREILDLAGRAGIACRSMPSLSQLLSGEVAITSVRPIEVEDLLRRAPVRLDEGDLDDFLGSKTVLVTGAGGSIGSELVRQVARFSPEVIVLLGAGENSLFQIERDLAARHPDQAFATIVGNVREEPKVRDLMARFSPEVVLHAAAHKHVPMMQYNPDEAILNNIGGTLTLARAAKEAGVRHFVNISSDKAVNPTSTMGFTKYVAEELVRLIASEAGADQVFVSVRFGNVLGSRGSVIPAFERQIRDGGPVTVTDPEMTRFFMTIPEASQLVLRAGAAHDNGVVYVLDMGDPVRIIDLARDVIRLSGSREDIEVVITGARPGEKLHEELFASYEERLATSHPQIMAARHPRTPDEHLMVNIGSLLDAAYARRWSDIDAKMFELVPTYSGRTSKIRTAPM